MKVKIVRGALIKLQGSGIAEFLQWRMDNKVYGYSVGSTGPHWHIGFYATEDATKIEEWAQRGGYQIEVGR